ncbi:MAG: SDR family NAD(P)-dependent oxidoreductase [bacterium]
MAYNVLVTGGAGFIGSHLVDELVRKGHKVKVLDNLEPQVHGTGGKIPEYMNSSVDFIKRDIRSRKDVKDALRDVEVVFHLAAAVGVGQSMYEVEKYVDVNSRGTAVLLDVLVNERNNVQKLIVASSMSIYGEGRYDCGRCGSVFPKLRGEDQFKAGGWEVVCPKCGGAVLHAGTSEDKPLYPTSIYAMTKRDQEEMCLAVGRTYGIPTVALRYFNAYGRRQSLNNPYTGVVAIFSARLLNDKPPVIYEDGLQTRDFVHVYDVVQANILAMESDKANYESFNVGTGRPITILEVANFLAKAMGKNVKPEVEGKFRAGDVRHCYADISKIERLGYKPRVSFEEGIADLVDWVKSEGASDSFERAAKELADRGLTR